MPEKTYCVRARVITNVECSVLASSADEAEAKVREDREVYLEDQDFDNWKVTEIVSVLECEREEDR